MGGKIVFGEMYKDGFLLILFVTEWKKMVLQNYFTNAESVEQILNIYEELVTKHAL
jgi:UTP-glucose-1-phosphate uridylyltransferase